MTLTVKKLTAKVSISAVSSSAYGKAVKVTVKVVDSRGKAASGKVTLSGAGSSRTVTLSSGQAVVTLPTNLAVKSYTLKASYGGQHQRRHRDRHACPEDHQGRDLEGGRQGHHHADDDGQGQGHGHRDGPEGGARHRDRQGQRDALQERALDHHDGDPQVRQGHAVPAEAGQGTWKVSVKYLGSTTYAAASGATTKLVVTK